MVPPRLSDMFTPLSSEHVATLQAMRLATTGRVFSCGLSSTPPIPLRTPPGKEGVS